MAGIGYVQTYECVYNGDYHNSRINTYVLLNKMKAIDDFRIFSTVEHGLTGIARDQVKNIG